MKVSLPPDYKQKFVQFKSVRSFFLTLFFVYTGYEWALESLNDIRSSDVLVSDSYLMPETNL